MCVLACVQACKSAYASACLRVCVCSFVLSCVRVFVRESLCMDERAYV